MNALKLMWENIMLVTFINPANRSKTTAATQLQTA